MAHFSYSGCKPAWQNDNEPKYCKLWTEEVVEYIATHRSINHVVISYRLNQALFGSHVGVWPAIPNAIDPGVRQMRWNALLGVIKRFQAAGKSVVLVLQAPEIPTDVQNLILNKPVEENFVKGVTVDWWLRRSAFVKDALSQIPKDVFVFDPTLIFCVEEQCYAARNGKALYFDNNHMSVEGAKLIAAGVIQKYTEH